MLERQSGAGGNPICDPRMSVPPQGGNLRAGAKISQGLRVGLCRAPVPVSQLSRLLKKLSLSPLGGTEMNGYLKALIAGVVLGAPACSQIAQGGDVPAEPYRFVYSAAGVGEVTLLDLNSVVREGPVAYAWSLSFLAQPVKLSEAPKPANVYWLKSRIDCEAGSGEFVRAIGLEGGEAQFDVQVTSEPTPLADAWPLDEEFLCKGVQPKNIAGTSFAEAEEAADKIFNPAAPEN